MPFASQGNNFFFVAFSRGLTRGLPIEVQRFLEGNTQRFFEYLFRVLLTIDAWYLSNPANPLRPGLLDNVGILLLHTCLLLPRDSFRG